MPSELMTWRELLRLGARNVGRNRRRSLITGVMVALAVTGVVFFKGYALGIRTVLLEMAVEGVSGALQLQREGYAASQDLAPLDLDLPADPSLLARLEALPNVKAVAPRLSFTAFASNGDSSIPFTGLGVDPRAEPRVCPRGPGQRRGPDGVLSGAPLAPEDEDGIVLSEELAQALGAKVGDTLVLLARTKGGAMDTRDVTVRGVFRLDDPLGTKQLAVVPLGLAQGLLHMNGRMTALTIAVDDLSRLEATAEALRAEAAGLEQRAAVLEWAHLSPYYRDVIELQDGMLGVVLWVVVLIVLAGIANTMMMSTFERRREVGTLMSMGFRRRWILALFVVEAGWLGVLAAAAGGGVGAALVSLAHHTGIDFAVPAGGVLLTHPVLRGGDVAAAGLGALLCAAGATLIPAYRASRLQPVAALRAT